MSRSRTNIVCLFLACAIVFGLVDSASARINSGAFRRYMQQQQKAQTQMMQMEQKAMQQEMMRQAAIEKQRRENQAKASKARHDKEEQHRQDLINKRKAEQATRTTSTTETPVKATAAKK
jgi:predicted Holliday junction resolvase-like endonuclease